MARAHSNNMVHKHYCYILYRNLDFIDPFLVVVELLKLLKWNELVGMIPSLLKKHFYCLFLSVEKRDALIAFINLSIYQFKIRLIRIENSIQEDRCSSFDSSKGFGCFVMNKATT